MNTKSLCSYGAGHTWLAGLQAGQLLRRAFLLSLLLMPLNLGWAADAPPAQTNAGEDPGNAIINFHGVFPSKTSETEEPRLIYSTHAEARLRITGHQAIQTHQLTFRVLQGQLKHATLAMTGKGQVLSVNGDGLLDWGVRQDTQGQQFLVFHTQENARTNLLWKFTVESALSFTNTPFDLDPLVLAPVGVGLFDGFLRVTRSPELEVMPTAMQHLTPIDAQYFPGSLAIQKQTAATKPDDSLTFRFSGQPYALTLRIQEADPDLRKIRMHDFSLSGEVNGEVASFVLTGRAEVRHPEGGMLNLLSGLVSLTGFEPQPHMELQLEQGRYMAHFSTNGSYVLELKFDARVLEKNGWRSIDFLPPPSALRPVELRGIADSAQVEFAAAAEAMRLDDRFRSYLPASGPLNFKWQEARPEVEGKLFFAVTGASQITVSPGLIRQVNLFEYQVLQGELKQLELLLDGDGEITRVQGDGILTWNIVEDGLGNSRRLVIQLNQAQKETYLLSVQSQNPLSIFPLKFKPLRVVPENAIRFGGYMRVVNAGAVRLEVLDAPGLAQISPDRFPQVKALGGLSEQQSAQAFAFRFSGSEFDLEIQADNVIPELTVSEVLVYRLGQTETTIEAELELEIREAPLREFEIKVPGGYGVAFIQAPHLGDYGLGEPDSEGAALLQLQFSQPLLGRQIIQVRLTRSHAAPDVSWVLVPLQPQKAKSVRGFVGMAADAGLRLTEGQVEELTEIATAFFPKKVPELQLAYRLRDFGWQATLNTEQLALSIQADSLQLFSIGEGIAFGSSVFNYMIAGAPVATFKVQVPTNYANLEFTGRDIRNWKKVGDIYEVYLHTPISGTYSLLATFDLQIDPRGQEVLFNGLEPLEVQSEQGYVIVGSTYQFQTQSVEISPGLIPLEPGEIPAEYRLLFDAPILRAYQFTSRPFQVRLNLTPLGQGETVNQVVDRATFMTHVSGEGQALTDVTYLIKTKGHSHLRLTIPQKATLWSAMVNGQKVVPVTDQQTTMIPLPQNVAPNSIIPVELKLAVKSDEADLVKVALPQVDAPILLADWQVRPDQGYRLDFAGGSVIPLRLPDDISGFAWLSRVLLGRMGPDAPLMLVLAWGLLLLGAVFWRWATREGMVQYSWKNILGGGLGVLAILAGLGFLVTMAGLAVGQKLPSSEIIAFMIPVQEPGGILEVSVKNRELDALAGGWVMGWPIYCALLVWAYAWFRQKRFSRLLWVGLGWSLVFWGTLRITQGAPLFLSTTGLFALMHILIPLIQRQCRLPRRVKPETPAPAGGAVAVGLIAASLLLLNTSSLQAASSQADVLKKPLMIESVIQSARVKEQRVFVQATLKWKTEKDQVLDFLKHPAVLTRIDYPRQALKLVQDQSDKQIVFRLLALESGTYSVSFAYEIELEKEQTLTGFHLPTRAGLINRLDLDLDWSEVEMMSENLVSVRNLAAQAGAPEGRTRFDLVLSPVENAWVAWRPRIRDTSAEKAVFYAELFQLFIPTAGIIEGVHDVQIRPSKGQLAHVELRTPEGMTITDVQATALAGWKFDPDSRSLRVQFEPAHAGPFAIRLDSQVTTSPLPFAKEIGLITVEGASGKVIGMVGVATGSEVSLVQVTPVSLSPINLEDFPSALAQDKAALVPGLTVRRAFRSDDPQATLTISAAAVQPDIRVLGQQTLSLGEDRTVLAARLDVTISRAGVFKLSFVLPPGMDVESLTGAALSHWTELKAGEDRIITMHLKGKTEGKQTFSLSLTTSGVPAGAGWTAPRLVLREASKQTGQLIVVPEQGMRLHIAERVGLTQVDPKEAGIKQKSVLVFRLLQQSWQLSFDVERVDPWVQVESLQDVTVREGQMKGHVTFDYTIENAGLKSLFIRLPGDAEGVRFTGDQVVDAIKSDTVVDAMVDWEIKLNRRVIGDYRLQAHYQRVSGEASSSLVVQGAQARQVNLQRPYLTLRSAGRLQLNITSTPPALQTVDWRSIPSGLRGGQSGNEGNYTFRAVESEYSLMLNVVRHAVEKLLPARVESAELTSTLSESGQMLTRVRLSIQPGDKRFLRLKLPGDARFWFAFVNNAGVWPWREDDQILIPLDENFKPGQPVTLEFLYSLSTGGKPGRTMDFSLLGPGFDLPLENISWNVYLPQNRELDEWEGDLQFQSLAGQAMPARLDLQSYMQSQSSQRKEQTRQAETMLELGNTLLTRGDQQEARKAFQSAWSLSQHDDAFNEDARVQLQNLKMQQALVGLNYRRNAISQQQSGAEGGNTNAALNILEPSQKEVHYTQQQVQQALELNPAEDNAALMRLASELIEQQDAAQVAPEGIQATLPEQGNRVTFTRSILVDIWAPLKLDIETQAIGRSPASSRFGVLFALFAGVVLFLVITRRQQLTR